MLKDYKDEEMKRDFYMKHLMGTIYRALEQLRTIEQEMVLLKYQKTLPKKTEEEKREEDRNYKAPPMRVYQVPVLIVWLTINRKVYSVTNYHQWSDKGSKNQWMVWFRNLLVLPDKLVLRQIQLIIESEKESY